MMKGPRFFKPLDFGAIGLALGITIVATVYLYARRGTETRILIAGEGKQWIFPQDAGELVTVPGPLGDTVVKLEDGKAWVLSSPCTNQTCVGAGAIRAHGQWIACLPNKVLVSIGKSGTEGATDGPQGEGLDGAAW
ncbi:MAG: NusG domain II-containing protein [Treponema sp.]|jgi:hypothetical protein|nr:NusG domain II-containing protein [Treponema sp.]